MSNVLLKYRNRIVFVLFSETVGFFIAYTILKTTSILALSWYTLVKNIVLGLALYFVFTRVKDESIKVSEVLGKDSKNAFLFGEVGLIIYDNQQYITWVSDLFIELGFDLIGVHLFEFAPELKESFDAFDEKILKVSINDQVYEIYNNKDSNTLYLKDITLFDELKHAYLTEKAIVGYVSIDNYDETINSVDEQKAALIQSAVRTSLFEWAKEYNIVIRRYTSETFFLVLNEEIHLELCENKFKILTIIREQANNLGVVLSLSIGIARKAESLVELDELAYQSLALAVSRGGDQVVIKTNGEQIKFYGGSTEKYSGQNRVRSRVVSQSLGGIIKHSKHILIMGHKESDFDSLGASIAVSKICDMYGIENNIVIDKDSIEEKAERAVLELNKIDDYSKKFIPPTVANDLMRLDPLVITVDNHKPSLAIEPKLLEAKEVVIIDHHRRGEEFIKNAVMTYLEPSASSTVELVCELFEYLPNQIELNEIESTVLYAGILVDTNYFKSKVGARTFQVASILKRLGCSVSKAYEYLEDDYNATVEKAKIIQSAIRYKNDIIISISDENEIYTRAFLAKSANDLLAVSKINGAFIIGKTNENVVSISARSKKNINSQLIMEKLGGGGHFTMAACQIENVSIDEIYKRLCDAIETYLEESGD